MTLSIISVSSLEALVCLRSVECLYVMQCGLYFTTVTCRFSVTWGKEPNGTTTFFKCYFLLAACENSGPVSETTDFLFHLEEKHIPGNLQQLKKPLLSDTIDSIMKQCLLLGSTANQQVA